MNFAKIPPSRLRLLQVGPRKAYAIGLGPLIGRVVLLLTTTGRRTGLKRVTPLQYELVDGAYYVASARGLKADWFRNLQADPHVEVQVKKTYFHGLAEVVTDPQRITGFLELRLKRHPIMIGLMMRAEGLGFRPSREKLEQHAKGLAMAIIRPDLPTTTPGG
ncbi:MAG: nitroreductase family deazaflavin-dependent oxidoreductase [Anaerolineales bacterium]|nr:nitroreductase family deazaflavin-dependent oxidoreductase [Anaerolineales bacterium]